MINGIFVPAGNLQGSEIIPFAARIVPDDVRPSDDRVNPSNFDAHATMQASLRTARQMCEDRLTRFSGIWEAILVPGFASPFNLTRRTIVVLCLLAVTAVSLGSAIWVGLTAAPPSVLRFAWLPFLVAGSHKVSAIWDYTQLNQSALNLAVFSVADFTDVRREWSVHAQETLLPASALNHGYILATNDKAKITFLFCDHLRDFIHYLHPWRWRWLAIRGVPVLLTPILAIPIIVVGLSVTPYSPPEFTPECVPTCTLINAGIYSTTMAPGKGSTIQINAGLSWVQGKDYPRRRIQF